MKRDALGAHCRALVACRMCGHPAGVTPIVSAAVRPKVMIVGQAPGQVEAAGGKVISLPFVEGASTTSIIDRMKK